MGSGKRFAVTNSIPEAGVLFLVDSSRIGDKVAMKDNQRARFASRMRVRGHVYTHTFVRLREGWLDLRSHKLTINFVDDDGNIGPACADVNLADVDIDYSVLVFVERAVDGPVHVFFRRRHHLSVCAGYENIKIVCATDQRLKRGAASVVV